MMRLKGPYYVDGGQYDGADDIILPNDPPAGQPELHCEWIPGENDDTLEWDGQLQFYGAQYWMAYLIQHFLAPDAIALREVPGLQRNHILNGTIKAKGEREDDRWSLIVENNLVYVKRRNFAARYMVKPTPYYFPIRTERMAEYVNHIFGPIIGAHAEDVGVLVEVPVDQTSGHPTNKILVLKNNADHASTPIAQYRINEDGKAVQMIDPQILAWDPEED